MVDFLVKSISGSCCLKEYLVQVKYESSLCLDEENEEFRKSPFTRTHVVEAAEVLRAGLTAKTTHAAICPGIF